MKEFQAELTAQRIESHLQARIAGQTLPGAVAGVWVNGEQRVAVCMGSRDPEKHLDMTPDTLFRLASMTKPVTGAAIMLQVERGKLQLDTPICKWMPAYEKMEVAITTPDGQLLATRPAAKQLTVRMLLSHTTGIGSGVSGQLQSALLRPGQGDTLESMNVRYARSLLDFQPGEAQAYSGLVAWDVLARLVELTSDMPYQDFLQKEILQPLEMADTTYEPTPSQQSRQMSLTDTVDGRLVTIPVGGCEGSKGLPAGYPGGGSGLFSTLQDYSHLALMYLNGGAYGKHRVLKPETVQQMSACQVPEHFAGQDQYNCWGLSMRVTPRQKAPFQPRSPGSFGWSGAYGTHFWVDPAKNMVAVYLSNLLSAGGASAATAFEFERDVMAGYGECE